MSDVREAFEAHVRSSQYTTGGRIGENYANPLVQRDWELWKAACAALQSQTAPAVPEGWKLVPIKPTKEQVEAEFPIDDIVSCRRHAIAEAAYRAMLAAAPQPDHSPDAGKVVYQCPRCSTSMEVDLAAKPTPAADGGKVEPQVMGRVAHLDDGSVVCHLNSVGRALPDHTALYTHPTESSEEIQAKALQSFGRLLADKAKNNKEAPEHWGYGSASSMAFEEAARLRGDKGVE